MIKKYKITVIGLGYVGLPLAIEFGKKFVTIGYDINKNRISELKNFIDSTNEVETNDLKKHFVDNYENFSHGFFPTSEIEHIKNSNIFIITVPTPIDRFKQPILEPLIKASKLVGNVLSKNNIVIYESTVYPGVTEDICVPILQKHSKLKFNVDFYVGYSPERINPGDKIRTLTKIKKVTSGSNKKSAKIIDDLYNQIIEAGTHPAPTIKVAEASKVIENSQRDINIAFVNELAKIFNLLNINTYDVLKAAATKWNFLNFKPGLVGGHCIGVDPYYLTQKAQEVGYYPGIILAGRRLNDSMSNYITDQLIKILIKSKIKLEGLEILILGYTFKENCPDIRNSKVIEIINQLSKYDLDISVYDPWVNIDDLNKNISFRISNNLIKKIYNIIILAVGHHQFYDINLDDISDKNSIIYDIKGFFGEKATHTL